MKKINEVPAEFHPINERRLELIAKRFKNGLTLDESDELDSLEAKVAEMLTGSDEPVRKARRAS